MGDLVGYARVSTTEQSLDIQLEQLKAAGCDPIFAEKKTGTTVLKRGELENCLKYVRKGDTLVVTRLDRLGRSVMDLMKIITDLSDRGVAFKVLSMDFDTSTPGGKAMLQMFMVFAELENNFRRERQLEGIAAAKERGVYRGARGAVPAMKLERAKALLDQGLSYNETARQTKVSARTLKRWYPGASQHRPLPASAVAKAVAVRLANRAAPPTIPAEPDKPEVTAPKSPSKPGTFKSLFMPK